MPPFGYVPYAPSSSDRYDDRGTDRITDLILRAGDIQAQRLGGTFGALGELGGELVGRYQEGKAEEERQRIKEEKDRRFVALVESSEPEDVFKGTVALYGMDGAKPYLDGYGAFLKQVEAAKDGTQKAKAEALKQLGPLTATMDGLSEEGRAKLYPSVHSVLSAAFPEFMEGTSAEYDPEQWPTLSQVGKGLSSGEIKTHWVKQRLPDGSIRDVAVPDQPGQEVVSAPEPAKPQVVGGSLVQVQPGGGVDVLYRAPEKPAGEGAHQWVIRNGQPVRVSEGEIQPGDLPYSSARQEAGRDETAFLLQGGTADKLPIEGRSSAVASAKASGGIDGTGFVPMNVQQQTKFSDFMDLRNKAMRLKALLLDPEVQSELGPVAGTWTGATKEFPLIGASTKVKEAFDLLGNLSDKELRKRTGAQASKQEYDRIIGFGVSAKKQPDSNLTNIQSILDEVEGALFNMGATEIGVTKTPDGKRWRRRPDGSMEEVTG